MAQNFGKNRYKSIGTSNGSQSGKTGKWIYIWLLSIYRDRWLHISMLQSISCFTTERELSNT